MYAPTGAAARAVLRRRLGNEVAVAVRPRLLADDSSSASIPNWRIARICLSGIPAQLSLANLARREDVEWAQALHKVMVASPNAG